MSTPQNEVKAAVATVAADATKVQAEVTTLRAKAVAWVSANPGKVVSIAAAVAALVVWKIL